MRRIVAFPCEGARLVGSIDEAAGTTGVLIVSGGNEIRCGAQRGMALLAARLAERGVPVFRFDRRGVGDAEGENRGYAASAPDIAAAAAAFCREQPQVARIVGFGNCDAATALLLFDEACDALVLANPWLGDEAAPPPPAAVRAHYWHRLRDLSAWRRFLSGRVSLCGLSRAVGRQGEQPLARRVTAALTARPTIVLLASGDRTAQVFDAATGRAKLRVVRVDTASHSFAGSGHVLEDTILRIVAERDDKAVS